jgi:ABC-type transport system involved in Fe-S cluster assembly fused permease/ATPase subunit
MKAILAFALAAAICAVPLSVRADTSTLVNRVIVNQALQQQMQNQLNVQQIRLQSQQDLTRANLQGELQAQSAQLQYILLEQQLQLLQLRQRARVHSSHSHKTRPHNPGP